MSDLNASDSIVRVDLRRHRTHVLVSQIMHLIDEYITDRENNNYRKAYNALYEAFHQAGVEVLTDHDRAMAGLPTRDVKGWTPQELAILEAARLLKM